MKYLNKSFSVGTENSAAYRDNYDRIFGKKSKPEKQPEIERCHECGSWEAQCSAPGPVPGCACARCLRATLVAAELRDRLNYERAEKAERERDEARDDCNRYIEEMQDMRPHAEGCNFRRRGDQVPCSCMSESAHLLRRAEKAERERDVARTIASANGHADLVAQRDRANAKAARLTKALVSITQLSEPHATAHGIAIKALNGGDE